MYIASQILAIIALALNLISRVFKKQSQCLIINFFCCLVNLFSCLLLTAYMGVAGLVISLIRSIVFYFYAKNKWDKKLWLLLLFVGLQLVACIITSLLEGQFKILDFILIFTKGSLYTIGAWQHNIKVFRWLSIISCVVAIIYFLILNKIGWMNLASEGVSIILLAIVMIKDFITDKKLTYNENITNKPEEIKDIKLDVEK